MKKTLIALLTLAASTSFASQGGPELAKQEWSFGSFNANWDKAQLYRGYTVATQVCMSCHSFKYISHRDLMRAGFTEEEVTAMAKAMGVELNAKLVSGLDAETAIGSYGKVPPDLSLMNKARHGGADYTYGILTGYAEDPELIAEHLPNGLPEGAHFNLAFPGNAIAMPAPLTGPDMVSYADGTPATVEQMAKDVAYFLQWTAEPERMERQHLGVFVLLYLAIFTTLAYLSKRVIWKDVQGH